MAEDLLLEATIDATAGVADASKLVARAEAPGMSGSVCEGNPAAMALTVPLADAEGRAEAVVDGLAETEDAAVLAGDVVLDADPGAGALQAAIARAAEASAVAPASRRILWVVSAI